MTDREVLDKQQTELFGIAEDFSERGDCVIAWLLQSAALKIDDAIDIIVARKKRSYRNQI